MADLGRFCLCPLKWVRYLGYTIIGVRGELSRHRNGHPTANYDTAATCFQQLGGFFFYIADGMHTMQPTPNM